MSEAGDTQYEFTIMSVSKPFVFALVCQAIGSEEARERLGVNATGLAFNSVDSICSPRNPRRPEEHGGDA
jgi:glutaminase